jgi:putative ABC transport system permease protein
MLMKVDPGFDPRNVLTASIQPRVAAGPGINTSGGSVSVTGAAPAAALPPDFGPLYQQIVDHVSQIPGVRHAAAIAGGTPLGGSFAITTVVVPANPQQKDPINVRNVTPDYMRTMGMVVIAGRHIEPSDGSTAQPVVIVNDSAAKKYFPGQNAVGRTLTLNTVDRTIVGVMKNVHQNSLELDPRVEAFVPLAQGRVVFAQLVVKTDDAPDRVLPEMRSAVLAVLPDVPLRTVRTMESVVGGRIAQRRLNMLLIGLFGLLGLVISAAGIYGLMAYVVSQRTHEIGVRMALGATERRVLGMVLRHAAVLVGAGLVAGGGVSWYLSKAVSAFLFRIEPTDPRAFAGAIVALMVAALAASLVPARRAAAVDPVVALRAQ